MEGHDHHHHNTTDSSGMDMHNKDGMDMHGGHDMGSMMQMYFYVGAKATILFKEWHVSTVGGMIGSVIGIFLLAMFYEGLKYFREHLFRLYLKSLQLSTVSVTEQDGISVREEHSVTKHRMLSLSHAIQTVLHILQMLISYFLMLIFMTYNVWLCLAVVFGSGLGYFLFGWRKATVVDVTEHCH